jgi:hypothetical protein
MESDDAQQAAERALAPIFGPSVRRFVARLVIDAVRPHLLPALRAPKDDSIETRIV